ncbi:MAG: hypothetical protein R3Y09_01330 [Clostridia bacterium]
MKIFVHYPKTDADKKELQRKVAEVHADAVYRKVCSLNCSKEQKNLLIKAVKEQIT